MAITSAVVAQIKYGDDIDAEIEELVSAIFDAIDSEDSETTTTPQDTESSTSTAPTGQPNFDNLSYEDAWKAEFGEDLEWAVNMRGSQKRPQGLLKMMLRTIERSPTMKELLFDYMDGKLTHVLKEVGFIK